MDGPRFATLVRTVVAPRTRRHLLQRLAAMGIATLGLRLGTVTVAGQVVSTDETCRQDSDCLPAEPDPCTGAYCDAGSCTYTSVACMRGHLCCGNGECCLEGEADTRAAGTGESGAVPPETTATTKPPCMDVHSGD